VTHDATPASSNSQAARDRILARIRHANDGREKVPHPGTLPSNLEPPVAFRESGRTAPLDAFEDRLTAAGGEVVRLADDKAAREWLDAFARPFEAVAVGEGLPAALCPSLPRAPADTAPLSVSMALAAAAQTGSLVLSSAEGRRTQLLPPVTIVWVRAEDIYPSLGEALERSRAPMPAALALHSGPSKSADIGRVLVRGVHGPGRIVAAVLGAPSS
jgi:L-lactate dehydrogenase complex protein LldG